MIPQRTNSVPAVERALAILEFLGKSRHGLTLSQVTRYLGLPKSSTHSLLLTFERCGYLQREAGTGRYRLGLRVCELAHMALNEKSQALDWLEKAVDVHCPLIVYLKVDPQFDGLRTEPRFRALLKRMGLGS